MRKLIVILALILISDVFGAGAIFNGPNIKLLKNNLKFKENEVKIMTGDADKPNAVSKEAGLGSLYIEQDTGIPFWKSDSGDSSNWTVLPYGDTSGNLFLAPLGNINLVADEVAQTGSGAMQIASGTTAARPNSPVAGQIRYNSENGTFEGYNGLNWGSVGPTALDTSITDSIDYTPTIIGIGTGTVTGVEGSWSRIGDKMIIQVAFNMATNGSAGGNVGATLPAGYEIDTTKLKYDSGNTASIGTTYFTGDIRLNNALSISSLPTNIYTQTAGSSATAGSRFSMQAIVPIVGWSSEKSTVVTQETELTAQTANEFSAKVSGTDVVVDENFDWIDGDCTNAGAGVATCNFISGVFSSAPNCVATPVNSTSSALISPQATTSSVTIVTQTSNGTNTDSQFNLYCSRSGDYNKSATIVGKFENINSSQLVRVKAEGNNNDVLTGGVTDIVFSEEVEDPYNAWDGSGFTAPKTANYLITGMMRFTTVATTQAVVYIDGASTETRVSYSPSDAILSFVGQVTLTQGQRLSLREPFARTLFDSEDYHHIEIQELPDTESIVKNLLAESSQTKCQTKILQGDITTNGSHINDLKFSNLKASRFYKLYVQSQIFTDPNNTVLVEIFNADDNVFTNKIGRIYQLQGANTGLFTTRSNAYVFKAVETFVTLYYTESGTTQRIEGDGTKSETFATLCEMPETYVETTEF